jgi:hypothetical protein
VKSSESLEGLISPSIRSSVGTPRDRHNFEPHPMIGDAWDALRRSLVFFRNKPVGTIAAMDPTEDSLNYNQVWLLGQHWTFPHSFPILFSVIVESMAVVAIVD